MQMSFVYLMWLHLYLTLGAIGMHANRDGGLAQHVGGANLTLQPSLFILRLEMLVDRQVRCDGNWTSLECPLLTRHETLKPLY